MSGALLIAAIIAACVVGVAVLPWTDEQLEESLGAWSSLWAWLSGGDGD